MVNAWLRRSSASGVMACLFALALQDQACAQTWQRSRMEQGYYSALVTAGSGAKLRVNCAPATDSDQMSVDSLTYTPRGAIREQTGLAATISVDGAAKSVTMAAKSDGSGPVEIWLESDDLDSIEAVKDLAASMRKGRSLTIAVPGHRDTFPLSGVSAALGKCE